MAPLQFGRTLKKSAITKLIDTHLYIGTGAYKLSQMAVYIYMIERPLGIICRVYFFL